MAAPVAIAHDYLTQCGGAERVVLTLMKAFPGAPLHTSLYEADHTFPEYASHSVQTLPLNRLGVLRRHHRWALPLLAPSFSRLRVEADVVLCSSSGWAHGVEVTGRKIVYCYAPARWIYQTDRYFQESPALVRAVGNVLRPQLQRWDRRAAATAHRYITTSSAVRDAIREAYGIDAAVVPPPPALDGSGPQRAVAGLAPGFVLCVCRLQPYKNVDAVIAAFAQLPDHRLVVVGEGRDWHRLEALLGPNAQLFGRMDDARLRWLYANCAGVVGAAYEDFGLTPLEAAAFAKPVAVLRSGGYLDTVVDGVTGVFFDEPLPSAVAAAVQDMVGRRWSNLELVAHAERFGEARFIERMQAIVAEESLLA
jgi:glycosyltransferase involved in cell wall biosynthesis